MLRAPDGAYVYVCVCVCVYTPADASASHRAHWRALMHTQCCRLYGRLRRQRDAGLRGKELKAMGAARSPRCLPSVALNCVSWPSYHASSSVHSTASRLPTHASAPSTPSPAAASATASVLLGVLLGVLLAGVLRFGVLLGLLPPCLADAVAFAGVPCGEAGASLAAAAAGAAAAAAAVAFFFFAAAVALGEAEGFALGDALGDALAAGAGAGDALAGLEGEGSLRARLGVTEPSSAGCSRLSSGVGATTDFIFGVKKLARHASPSHTPHPRMRARHSVV